MQKTSDQRLDQIEEHLKQINKTLQKKADHKDLEYELSEIASKLEEIHDDVIELQGELEDVKSQVDDLAE